MSEQASTKLAYNLNEAAAATGISTDVLRRAIRRGDLTASYPTSKPLILAAELQAWLEAAPTTSPRSA